MKNIFPRRPLLGLLVATAACISVAPAFADSNSSWVPSWNGPTPNWAGPYLGGFVGGTMTNFRDRSGTTGPSGSDTSFLGGGDVGMNWQINHVVLGIEGDFGKFNNSNGQNGTKFTEDWMSTARARAGYAFGQFLPYVTAGAAFTDTVDKVSGVGSDENVQTGYALGGGVDTMLSGNWFGRIEYLYTDVPTNSSTIGGTTVDGGGGNQTIRVGLNYKFN
jgi:outer membrane immunogenic protein